MLNWVCVCFFFRIQFFICSLYDFLHYSSHSIIMIIKSDLFDVAYSLYNWFIWESLPNLLLKFCLIHEFLLRFVFTLLLLEFLSLLLLFLRDLYCTTWSSTSLRHNRLRRGNWLHFFYWIFLFFLFFNIIFIFSSIFLDKVSPFIDILNSRYKWVVNSISSVLKGFKIFFDILDWKF